MLSPPLAARPLGETPRPCPCAAPAPHSDARLLPVPSAAAAAGAAEASGAGGIARSGVYRGGGTPCLGEGLRAPAAAPPARPPAASGPPRPALLPALLAAAVTNVCHMTVTPNGVGRAELAAARGRRCAESSASAAGASGGAPRCRLPSSRSSSTRSTG